MAITYLSGERLQGTSTDRTTMEDAVDVIVSSGGGAGTTYNAQPQGFPGGSGGASGNDSTGGAGNTGGYAYSGKWEEGLLHRSLSLGMIFGGLNNMGANGEGKRLVVLGSIYSIWILFDVAKKTRQYNDKLYNNKYPSSYKFFAKLDIPFVALAFVKSLNLIPSNRSLSLIDILID